MSRTGRPGSGLVLLAAVWDAASTGEDPRVTPNKTECCPPWALCHAGLGRPEWLAVHPAPAPAERSEKFSRRWGRKMLHRGPRNSSPPPTLITGCRGSQAYFRNDRLFTRLTFPRQARSAPGLGSSEPWVSGRGP